ncbi:hypothetical protein [Nitriliruptor alkaliphilus]|uniref:hypothetical protein n=1 Tax=Nitriliruptor alkaliphilus TaxID=427918 RepID=UPI00069729AB|nr:hypothetical protein [Nitriliruptor alkaliphilus]
MAEARVVDDRVTLRVSEQRDLASYHERLAALVRRYELVSAPDDPVAVANELLRRAWDTETGSGSWLRCARRTRRDGPDIVQPPVVNIAWGYDIGDTHAHVTTNCSPAIEGEPMDVFFTHDVRGVVDPDDGQPLWP